MKVENSQKKINKKSLWNISRYFEEQNTYRNMAYEQKLKIVSLTPWFNWTKPAFKIEKAGI